MSNAYERRGAQLNMESLYIRHDVISERKLARLNPRGPARRRPRRCGHARPDQVGVAVMFKRYPYTIGLLTVISFVVCVGWLFTHDACMHPIGNGLAAFWAFVECPVVFVALFEEAGE